MNRRRLQGWVVALGFALCVAACGSTSAAGQPTHPPLTPTPTPSSSASIGAGLTGPAGMSAAVYATGLVHAAAFAFDDQGRLWVATAAYNDTGDDAVYLVPAAGATPIKAIASLHTPLGLAWYGGSLYVSAAGGVTQYASFDGTKFAESKVVLALPSDVGEVNGLVMGQDGRFRMGVSSPCDHCDPANPLSATVLSFAPDGTGLQVMAQSIRAPVGLAYFPGTSDLFVTMNQRDDLGDATPGDWLSVVAEGQDWGFPDCYGQETADCAGTPQPVAVLDKHAAVSGVAFTEATATGGTAWVAEWQSAKLLRVDVTRSGSSYNGTVAGTITGMQNPVAVATGPDGALFAGDWGSGTVYRITG